MTCGADENAVKHAHILSIIQLWSKLCSYLFYVFNITHIIWHFLSSNRPSVHFRSDNLCFTVPIILFFYICQNVSSVLSISLILITFACVLSQHATYTSRQTSIEFLIIHFSPSYFFPLRFKHSSRWPVLKLSQFIFLLRVRKPRFTPIWNGRN